MREKGVRLETELYDSAALIAADSARLEQVLLNLLTNAIKFTPENGIIRIRTARQPGGRWRLRNSRQRHRHLNGNATSHLRLSSLRLLLFDDHVDTACSIIAFFAARFEPATAGGAIGFHSLFTTILQKGIALCSSNRYDLLRLGQSYSSSLLSP